MSEVFLTLLGGAGVGVLIQSIVQHFLSKSAKQEDRCFEERKEAYTAFLEALRKVQSDPDIAEKEVQLSYWANRAQLVCSEPVFMLLEGLRKAGRKSLTGQITTESLIVAMRRDLGVSR